ncbi:E3 ubiquitin-protein ligase E3D [Oryzias melastigma]|uniref:E3 ubiquitin-protein ligase E3D n=1 Tax=Oryzias melastigma TaxID=30732 RepID=A0A834C0A7_ORYME|nr:E3 ubiquitin-protein ligase E3D [Oryzias melastigma]
MNMTEHPSCNARGVGVFLELRKRLLSGLLIVSKEVAGSADHVLVTRGASSLVVRTPRGQLELTLPAGVSFTEGSCIPTPGESSEEELHFRLRITVEQSSHKEASDCVTETLRAKQTYCFYCQGCMTRLLEDRKGTDSSSVESALLPLTECSSGFFLSPNGSWNAIVDDWCCHPDPFASKKLLPRADDCLLGDTFVLLARDSSCTQTLTEEKPCRRVTFVSCASCSSVLGEAVSPEALKLYVTQVVVEPAVGDPRPAALSRQVYMFHFLEKTIAARLLKLSNSLSTFHFSVQTPDGNAFLLIWLLNSDSIIASVPEKCVGNDSSSAVHSSPLRAARALKLLYITCSDADAPQREVVSHWETSVIAHPLVLPLKVCEELQRVINHSHSELPSSMRSMRSYQVAYLRL